MKIKDTILQEFPQEQCGLTPCGLDNEGKQLFIGNDAEWRCWAIKEEDLIK